MSAYDIGVPQPTFDIGFFPSSSWGLTSASFGNLQLPTFNWIQAFWASNLGAGVTPQLVVSMGHKTDAGVLIGNLVRFSYSGERVPMKGKIILSSGFDRFGNAITSTPINSGAPTTSLTQVIAFGGQY
jgi:hypothetical protein